MGVRYVIEGRQESFWTCRSRKRNHHAGKRILFSALLPERNFCRKQQWQESRICKQLYGTACIVHHNISFKYGKWTFLGCAGATVHLPCTKRKCYDETMQLFPL